VRNGLSSVKLIALQDSSHSCHLFIKVGGYDMTLSKLFDLRGQVAIITGGSRGLGLQMAHALGEYGATIAIAARKHTEIESALQLLAASGVEARGFVADLTEPAAPQRLAQEVKNTFGRIDILVNNAGTIWGATAELHPVEAWSKVISLNLTSVFQLTQAVANLAFLPQNKGVVLNIASIEGLLGHHPKRPGTVAYSSAKGGVVNMTRALAAEWGPRNIRVNCIAPGYFPSKMTAATIDLHQDDLTANTPLGRLGGESDMMGPALLFCSDASAHITGQILVVDGGFSII